MDWFLLAVVATVMFGTQSFLYKDAIKNKANKYLVMFLFMLVVEILALSVFLSRGFEISNISLTIALGLLFAILFYSKNIGHFKALEYLPINKVFPITQSSVVLVILFSVTVLKETLTSLQVIGILLIFISVNLIHQNAKKEKDYKDVRVGYLVSGIVLILGASMVITNKYASMLTEIGFFIITTYFFLTLISFLGFIALRSKINRRSIKPSIKYGLIIGIVNFIGYFSMLEAIKIGPLSLIAMIGTTGLIITVLLGKIIHKETFTLKHSILILLIVLGIILIRI